MEPMPIVQIETEEEKNKREGLLKLPVKCDQINKTFFVCHSKNSKI
jgi:hypothetical protein